MGGFFVGLRGLPLTIAVVFGILDIPSLRDANPQLPQSRVSSDLVKSRSISHWAIRLRRSQRSRALPASLIRYSKVPRPRERLSSKPKFHSLLKYVQAERVGRKLSLVAASFGPSHSSVEANKDKTCSFSSLYL